MKCRCSFLVTEDASIVMRMELSPSSSQSRAVPVKGWLLIRIHVLISHNQMVWQPPVRSLFLRGSFSITFLDFFNDDL